MKIPKHILERYILRELPEKKLREIDRLADRDQALKSKIEKLIQSSGDILRRYPPEETASKIRRRCLREKNRPGDALQRLTANKKFICLPASLLTAALLFFVLLPVLNENTGTRQGEVRETTRIKGPGAGLFLYRKNDTRVELLAGGAAASKNDLIQIGYFSNDPYGMIFSVDGRGEVTLHFPEPVQGKKLVVNKRILLNKSYELDDAPRFENFYLVTSPKGLDAEAVIQRIKSPAAKKDSLTLNDLGLDKSCHLVIQKLIKR